MKIYEEGGITWLEMFLPNNFHVHWREIEQLMYTLQYSAMQFGYTMGMPNLIEPLINMLRASGYYDAIQSVKQKQKLSAHFKFRVTEYLTDNTTVEDVKQAKESGIVLAMKLYPSGATTNSSSGVTNIPKMWPIFAYMEEHDIPLSVHGEVTNSRVSLYDRERVFVETILTEIHRAFPHLRIILEHISTKEGVQFVQSAPSNIVGTVTAPHLLCNCNNVYMYPSRNCYPVINSPADQEAIIIFATSGNSRCFLGTDSAPHADSAKFCDGGNGGCFTEPYAIPLYIKAFERAGALDERFEAFASFNGADFYGLPRNTAKLRLAKKPQVIAREIMIAKDLCATPFMAGEVLDWSIDSII